MVRYNDFLLLLNEDEQVLLKLSFSGLRSAGYQYIRTYMHTYIYIYEK